MKPYCKLKFPFQFIKDECKLPVFDDDQHWHWKYDPVENYITDEGIQFLKSFGITEIMSQVFCGWPAKQSAIHVDARVLDDGSLRHRSRWAINFPWNVSKSEMMWYEPITTEVTGANSFSPNKIKYNVYKEHQVKEIERIVTDGLLLVRIDIPHAVVNYDDNNNRYCISLRDHDLEWSWEQAVEHFKPYTVE